MASARKPPVASTKRPSGEPKKPTIFDTISALSSTRPLTYQNIVEQNWPYEPFLINRAFSLSEDTVLAAAQMNQRPTLSKDMHATYYIHSVRPRRRFEKWPKQLDDHEASILAQYYGMSLREAKLHLHLHTKETLHAMEKMLADGARPSRYK